MFLRSILYLRASDLGSRIIIDIPVTTRTMGTPFRGRKERVKSDKGERV